VGGAVLTVVGLVGFLYCASFDTGSHIPSEKLFGILSVNGWHDLLHVLTGLAGLRAARTWAGARAYCYALFDLYTAILVLGLAYGTNDAVLSLFPINSADDVLHGIIAFAALVCGLSTPATPPPTHATEPSLR
jgi:hypothetical protein